jgi:hypothetical protein
LLPCPTLIPKWPNSGPCGAIPADGILDLTLTSAIRFESERILAKAQKSWFPRGGPEENRFLVVLLEHFDPL